VALQFLAQLAHEHVHRAVAVGHRVAPDLLVDVLALDHLAVRLDQQLQQLELAAGEADALAARTPGTGADLSSPATMGPTSSG
jgi:hypothetical protein